MEEKKCLKHFAIHNEILRRHICNNLKFFPKKLESYDCPVHFTVQEHVSFASYWRETKFALA
jgi:hypothetical protein